MVGNAAALARAFRRHQLPVVLVTNAGTAEGRTTYSEGATEWPAELTELEPALGAEAADVRVAKHGWSAFGRTGLDDTLRAAGVTQVTVVGVATSYGVESTARAAYDLGYHVTVASDAVTDRTLDGHEHSLSSVIPTLGQVGTTDEVIALLDARTGPA